MTESRRYELFPNVTDEQWNDWKWQVRNRIETLEDLKKYVTLTPEEEEGVKKTLQTLRMAITPYYISLIDPNNPDCPVRKQAVPTAMLSRVLRFQICRSTTTKTPISSGRPKGDTKRFTDLRQ